MTQRSVTVEDESTHDKLADILSHAREDLGKWLPEGSHAKLVWEQRIQEIQAKDKRQMRWYPDISRAIALHSKSAAAYRVIRESEFLVLPHPIALYTDAHFTQLEPGLNADLVHRIYVDEHSKCT